MGMDTDSLRWFAEVADGVTVTEVSELARTSQPGGFACVGPFGGRGRYVFVAPFGADVADDTCGDCVQASRGRADSSA